MPYVTQDIRDSLEIQLQSLSLRISEVFKDRDSKVCSLLGILNYSITRLLQLTWSKCNLGNFKHYSNIAMVTGVLENVKQEFYRRIASPYEDEKAKENGDVY